MLALMFEWAELENALALLLGKIIHDPSNSLASAIYFAPSNTETRMGIVTAALKVNLSPSPHFTEILKRWKTLQNRFGRKKNIRNQIAHGQIITIRFNGKNHIRLTSPLFDFSRHSDSLKKGQKPGLGPSEITNAATGIKTLTLEIHEWWKIVSAPHSKDVDALLEKLPPPNSTPPQ